MMEITTPATIDDDFVQMVLDHCKIDAGDPEDLYEHPGDADLVPLVEQYIEAAIGRVEACSGRVLFKRSLRFTADRFPAALVLPASPVIEVTQVEYLDAQGGLVTLPSASYALIDRLGTPKLIPAMGHSWPATAAFPGAVLVDFDAGYGEGMEDIPAPLRQAVMQTVADWFRFAGNVATAALHELPDSAYRACQPFRREWA